MNCWEFMVCSTETRDNCPAYPEEGRRCWKVTGTMCDKGRMQAASVQEKVAFCRNCGFYIAHAERF